MFSSVGASFKWPQAAEIASELSAPGESADVEIVAERINNELNNLVPMYDDKHRLYSPEEAIEGGKTTCKTRAYMAHLIAMQATGIRSAVYLSTSSYPGHAATYVTDGESAAVIDSTRHKGGAQNSFFVVYDYAPRLVSDTYPMLEYFMTNDVTKGFAWVDENAGSGIEPSGTAVSAESEPLSTEIPNLLGMLMIGKTGRKAMNELLTAKHEMVYVKGPDLDDLLGDNCLFPNALVTHPQFF